MVELDLEQMTDEQLYELIEDAHTELGRRQTRDVFEQQVNELYESARASGAITAPEQGEQWKQPLGAHDAYAKGDVVTHDGVQWVSTVTPNTWAPGVSGWHRTPEDDPETGEPGIPEWVRPSGTHDAYALGDRVTYNGTTYESVHPTANTWAPDEYGWEPVDGEA